MQLIFDPHTALYINESDLASFNTTYMYVGRVTILVREKIAQMLSN
jgi:hypothetical protein